MAWNPLHEMGPLTNPGKVALSRCWKLQTFLDKRQQQARFDLKEKGNYKPLANRRDTDKPVLWKDLQKEWPNVTWDDDIRKIKLDALPEEDRVEANNIIEEVLALFETFKDNMRGLSGRSIERNPTAKDKKEIADSHLITFSDASGGEKYSIYGACTYLRYSYEDGTYGWILLAAVSKVAGQGFSIVVKELKGLKLAVQLAKRINKIINNSAKKLILIIKNFMRKIILFRNFTCIINIYTCTT